MPPIAAPLSTGRASALAVVAVVLLAGCAGPTADVSTTPVSTTDVSTPTAAGDSPTTVSFSVSLSDSSVVAGGDETTLSVSGTDAGAVVVSAQNASASLVAALVGGERVDGGVRVAVPADGEIPVTPPACHSGAVSLRVSPVGSDATESVLLRQFVAPDGEVGFLDSTVSVERGETATLGISVDCPETVTLELRDRDGGRPIASARLVNASDSDRIRVRVDTAAGNASALFAVIDGATLANANATGDLPLGGDYVVALVVGGEDQTLGTLRVGNASADAAAARSP